MADTIETPLELLISARELILEPDAWIQGTFALNARGHTADPDSSSAVCWCVQGALIHEQLTKMEGDSIDTHRVLVSALTTLDHVVDILFYGCDDDRSEGAVDFNDHEGTTHDDVIHVLDLAIARLTRGRDFDG